MRGSIFFDQKCPIYGGNFERDDRRRGLFCPEHPEQTATGRFRVQFGRKARRRFSVYREPDTVPLWHYGNMFHPRKLEGPRCTAQIKHLNGTSE
jgi:hypothetical protein